MHIGPIDKSDITIYIVATDYSTPEKEEPMQRYLSRKPRSISAGQFLVHNHVPRPPRDQVGVNGWRIWVQDADSANPPLVPCDCGWAGNLGAHHKVNRQCL
jgi:hypothetical protein